jgi:hypothetical protein
MAGGFLAVLAEGVNRSALSHPFHRRGPTTGCFLDPSPAEVPMGGCSAARGISRRDVPERWRDFSVGSFARHALEASVRGRSP